MESGGGNNGRNSGCQVFGCQHTSPKQINGGEVRIRYHQKSNKLCVHNNEPDQRSLVARRLWDACAIPSIIYCLEAMVFTRKTLAELEQIQCMVGCVILQVPAATSRVLVWCDAGLMPMEHRIQSRQFKFGISARKKTTTDC